jgi:hypothetical protein
MGVGRTSHLVRIIGSWKVSNWPNWWRAGKGSLRLLTSSLGWVGSVQCDEREQYGQGRGEREMDYRGGADELQSSFLASFACQSNHDPS